MFHVEEISTSTCLSKRESNQCEKDPSEPQFHQSFAQKTVSDCTISFIQRVDCLKPGQKVPLKSDVYVIKKIVIGELKAKEKKALNLNQQTGVKVPDFCVESIFPHQKMGTLVNVVYFIKVTGKLSLATDLDYECGSQQQKTQ
ncbi:hypothetical protein FDP41_012157 [Naegleria fowleri]|uniref:Uncharacterized protein n=1 Tax=Naegleria fowleri TaxID=5763 RepID=A0A6A5C6T6_NAEFO|nr:uncharacterized protein FDP41_012157 [Naegleria fowleri]KAF0981500.1 hypothetical protein FDP41_012157 [Naegleria fowleri]